MTAAGSAWKRFAVRLLITAPFALAILDRPALSASVRGTQLPVSDFLLVPVIPPPPQPTAVFSFLYADPTGRPVMEYDLGTTHDDRVYFSPNNDFVGEDDQQASALANSSSLLSSYTASHSLVQLDLAFSIKGDSDRPSMEGFYFGGTNCQWPYSSGLSIRRPTRPSVRIMFLRARVEPKAEKTSLFCENGPGDVTISVRYDVVAQSMFLSADRREAFLALERPPSVYMINALGRVVQSPLFNDVVAVPAELAEDAYGLAARSIVPPQEAVDLFEAEVQEILKTKAGVHIP